ncbi:MAG: amidohydrolase, partial [Chloroflexi bacterium]|nr:amidohydrolase [Chloroflexota bacterium]
MTDLILRNGNIYTLDDARPNVSALAIEGERIVRTGDDETVMALKDDATTVIDLAGSTVVPGLTDAHAHMRNLGQVQHQVGLRDARSFDEIVDMVRARADSTPRGQWVLGRSWNQELWTDTSLPSHHLLSEKVPDHPVWLVRVDGHAGIANEAAMKAASFKWTTESPTGGLIVKDGEEPTGVFVDSAMPLIASHIPSISVEQAREFLLTAQELCLASGLTEIHDAGIDATTLEAYRSLVREGRLKIRIYAMLARDFFESEDHVPIYDGRFTCRSVKIVSDGALGSRGAAFIQPYSDAPDETGFMRLTQDEIRATVDRALRSGFQVNTHAIGDLANRVTLDVLEAALAANPVRDHRSRIEHAQILTLEDIPRLAQMDVIASIQATH